MSEVSIQCDVPPEEDRMTVKQQENAIGTEVVTTKAGPDITFRSYVVDRPTHTKTLKGAEATLEIEVTLHHPVKKVWPVLKDFNKWMNRYGYNWDAVPADNEGRFVHL